LGRIVCAGIDAATTTRTSPDSIRFITNSLAFSGENFRSHDLLMAKIVPVKRSMKVVPFALTGREQVTGQP
jgi:hypothetical protein